MLKIVDYNGTKVLAIGNEAFDFSIDVESIREFCGNDPVKIKKAIESIKDCFIKEVSAFIGKNITYKELNEILCK